VPPNPRPIRRFIADTTQEGIPHGRFAERLREAFAAACEEIADLPEGAAVPGAARGIPPPLPDPLRALQARQRTASGPSSP